MMQVRICWAFWDLEENNTIYTIFLFCITKFTKINLCHKSQQAKQLHQLDFELTAHNWQIWKRVFLTCSCQKICRDKAVGLKSCKYTLKNYDSCEYVKFGAISWKFDILSITCVTYDCDYLQHSTFRFNVIDFQLNTDFPSQYCLFYSKIT